jgi:hypothetical protein
MNSLFGRAKSMTSEGKPSEKLKALHNPAVISIIIAVISLTVTFTGMNYQNISSWFSQQMFPTADFTLTSFEVPLALPFSFTLIRNVSSEYYITTSISLKSNTPYLGSPLQFSISFENKGKKTVEQPRILIYATDYMYRIWSMWNESDVNKKIVTKGCNLEYYFPPVDQKAIGAWSFYVLLYDDSNGQLVSYAAKEFMTTDVAPIPWYQNPLYVVTIIAYIAVFSYIGYGYSKKRKKQKAKSKSKEDKDTPTADVEKKLGLFGLRVLFTDPSKPFTKNPSSQELEAVYLSVLWLATRTADML